MLWLSEWLLREYLLPSQKHGFEMNESSFIVPAGRSTTLDY